MQKRSYTQDAAMPAGRNSSDIGVIMKPEGSMKICVLNGSRRVDKVVGRMQTQKVLLESVCQKAFISFPRRSRHPRTFIRIPM